MDYNDINLIALGGKIAIESTSAERSQKEVAKFGIDYISDAIKQFCADQQGRFSVMGLSLTNIHAIKAAAQMYGIDQVILFPCQVNGAITPCIKVKGGDVAAFFQAIGNTPLEKFSVNSSDNEQSELIDRYGVIVYSKAIKTESVCK